MRPPPAQARPGLPPASQPASPAFLLPSQTLEWPGGAPRDGPTEVQKGAAEVMLPKFHCTTEILLEKGPLGAGRVPWSCPSFSLLLHSFYKAETSVWLWEAGQASSCLGARSPIHKLRGLSCSWLLGPLQWEARPAPRRGHLTESWLTVRPRVGHVASLSLSFPVYKTGVSVPTSKVVPGQG